MSNYTGSQCPVCRQLFTDHDDIVVCPDCGTPYHRVCWPSDNRCLSTDLHGTGYIWQPEHISDEVPGIKCPHCGSSNPAGSRFCCQCGSSLGEQPPRVHIPGQQQYGYHTKQTDSVDSDNQNRQPNYDCSQRYSLGPNDLIDGVKARDWADFLGRSVPYYLLRFQSMSETGRKFCVSFSAFLFGPFYFLYRKAWKPAVFFCILSVLLEIPSILALLYIADGLPAWLSNIALINLTSQIGSYVNWAQMFFRGIFGVYLYRKAVLPRVQDICNHMPEDSSRSAALRRVGGTSLVGVAIYAVILVALYLLIYLYVMSLGDDALNNIILYTQQVMNYLG